MPATRDFLACITRKREREIERLYLCLRSLSASPTIPSSIPAQYASGRFYNLVLTRSLCPARVNSVRVYAFHKCSILRIRRPSFIRSRVRCIVEGYFCLRLKQEPPSSPITTPMPLTDLPRSFQFYLHIFAFYIFYTYKYFTHIYSLSLRSMRN